MAASQPLVSLVADVGGTNTRVALADGETLRPSSIHRFRNAEFDGLGAVLEAYLDKLAQPTCDAVCAAVAGPVTATTAQLTNLDWRFDTVSLATVARAKHAALLNDLQAQGHGVAHIAEDKLRPVLPGAQVQGRAAKLVIGVGTGFNIAPIFPIRDGQLVTAAEAGHAALPVASQDDLALAEFVAKRHGFADVEEVLSGRGLETIFAWVTERAGRANTKSAAEIAQGFGATKDPDITKTATVFAKMLGRVAGDLSLIHMPFGGVYFSGGVARAFAPFLQELGFHDAFQSKGRFSDLMAQFPVQVIEDDFAALSGCAAYLCQEVAAGNAPL